MVEQRENARAEKKWKLADKLRIKIYDLGFIIEDAEGGSVVKRK